MAEVKKYFVARGPFHLPSPIIEEGSEVELDSGVAAQFVREGVLNPVGFETDESGNPKVADGSNVESAPAEEAAPATEPEPATASESTDAPAEEAAPSQEETAPADGAPATGE